MTKQARFRLQATVVGTVVTALILHSSPYTATIGLFALGVCFTILTTILKRTMTVPGQHRTVEGSLQGTYQRICTAEGFKRSVLKVSEDSDLEATFVGGAWYKRDFVVTPKTLQLPHEQVEALLQAGVSSVKSHHGTIGFLWRLLPTFLTLGLRLWFIDLAGDELTLVQAFAASVITGLTTQAVWALRTSFIAGLYQRFDLRMLRQSTGYLAYLKTYRDAMTSESKDADSPRGILTKRITDLEER